MFGGTVIMQNNGVFVMTDNGIIRQTVIVMNKHLIVDERFGIGRG